MEKLVLLERLIALEPHERARARLVALVRDRAAEDARLSHVLPHDGDAAAP